MSATFLQQSIPGQLAVLTAACALGIFLGRIKILNVSIGAGGVLFSSLLLGHLGFGIEHHTAELLRDGGLALFVYTVGIQIGPVFFSSFKREGIKLNILAALIVSSGFLLAVAIKTFTDIDVAKIAGIMSGAVTNTPGLAAAQQILSIKNPDEPYTAEICAMAYAVTYPFGIFGIIFAILLLKKIFIAPLGLQEKTFEDVQTFKNKDENELQNQRADIFALCTGVFLGILLGRIPIKIPGVEVPLKLGSAGGPLIVALFLGKLKSFRGMNFSLPLPANLSLRELGISIFLACVGLRSGGRFAENVLGGEGIYWLLLGAAITFIPLVIVGIIALKLFKISFFSLCGLLSGSMTDPPALSFAETYCKSERPALSFTSVYALTMFLRIIFAQILVVLF